MTNRDIKAQRMVEHSSSTETSHHEPVLTRRLGLATATALVVAEVIGVGIFLTPAGMASRWARRSGCWRSG